MSDKQSKEIGICEICGRHPVRIINVEGMKVCENCNLNGLEIKHDIDTHTV